MDDGLIILAKAGDETAFEKLVKKAWETVSVLAWVFYGSISMQDLEDVLKELRPVNAKKYEERCNPLHIIEP